MKKVVFVAVAILLISSSAVYATSDYHQKRNICHRTESSTHPWEAIQIDESAYQTHLAHGDFDYLGPLKDNGHPSKSGNEWCSDHVPIPPVEPPKPSEPGDTPSSTVLPPTTVTSPPERPLTELIGK